MAEQAMIPNLDQLLIVCGISLAGVALIVWLLLKIFSDPHDGSGDEINDDKEER
jgi:hypothetical protein